MKTRDKFTLLGHPVRSQEPGSEVEGPWVSLGTQDEYTLVRILDASGHAVGEMTLAEARRRGFAPPGEQR